MFKGVDFWPHGTQLPIMELRRICIAISWVAAALAIAMLFARGLNFGIDFKGGSLFEVRQTSGTVDVGKVRETLGKLGLGEVQIQSLDQPGEILIRVETQKPKEGENAEQAQQAVEGRVRGALGSDFEFRRTEVVGPAVSSELKRDGVIAVSFAILGILLYVWFRFEWQFGVAAILALVHDIFITLGVFSLLRLDFGLSEVAALLTLSGYSINDTVVVFDRIRENLRRYKKMPIIDLMNLSINETLSRTVLTATTTFLAVLALYVFGTEVIKGFSFAMLFGIIIGTWSSIFVASPFLMWIGVKRDWSSEGSASKGSTAKV
ncbi:MAG TPA: protein translocase subunit SecF [Hyphomicrobiaceae bacterium]|nr:protein translocase subunit SecF [Hyphomicrobiaceae bacterium]